MLYYAAIGKFPSAIASTSTDMRIFILIIPFIFRIFIMIIRAGLKASEIPRRQDKHRLPFLSFADAVLISGHILQIGA